VWTKRDETRVGRETTRPARRRMDDDDDDDDAG